MEQARVWFAHGLYMELGMNLSAQFLSDLKFPDRLLTLVRENNLDPSMVTLELTETAAMQDPAVALDILARLRVKNINLCLDDFGTGASSLTHLYKMPFSEVKLDNQFTNDMRLREDARALVEGLVYLAHKLKMRACAEGVEDEGTLEMLEAMHCDKAQGHLFGAAVRARELEARRRALEQPVSEQIAAESRRASARFPAGFSPAETVCYDEAFALTRALASERNPMNRLLKILGHRRRCRRPAVRRRGRRRQPVVRPERLQGRDHGGRAERDGPAAHARRRPRARAVPDDSHCGRRCHA